MIPRRIHGRLQSRIISQVLHFTLLTTVFISAAPDIIVHSPAVMYLYYNIFASGKYGFVVFFTKKSQK
jgi:hypothetical protein